MLEGWVIEMKTAAELYYVGGVGHRNENSAAELYYVGGVGHRNENSCRTVLCWRGGS